MSDADTYSALNHLLIELGRSLLQYVGECWPWTDPNTTEEQQKIQMLVVKQELQVAELANLLHDANWSTDYGTYPTEYTDLHYVALGYLLDQLIQNQQALLEEAKRTLAACQDDPAARKLVGAIQSTQQTILDELQILAQSTLQDSTKFS
jgi:hypothetical protein